MKQSLKTIGVFLIACVMDKTTEANILSLNRAALVALVISALFGHYYPAAIVTFAVCILIEKILAVVGVKWPNPK